MNFPDTDVHGVRDDRAGRAVRGKRIMTRWNWKRWAWAIVAGTTLAGSYAAADDLPKAGETITLTVPGQGEKTVSVVKSVRKSDGSVETEVKDTKSGEIFTLIDPAPENKVPARPVASPPPISRAPVTTTPALPSAPNPSVTALPTKPATPMPPAPAKPLSSSFAELPQMPRAEARPMAVPKMAPTRVEANAPMAGPTPMPPMHEPADRRRLFNREPMGPSTVPHTPASAAATPVATKAEEKKSGLLNRVFGSKKPQMVPVGNPPTPPSESRSQAKPATTNLPRSFSDSSISAPVLPPTPRVNAEPPRAMPPKPTAPSAPGRIEPVVPPKPVIQSVPTPPSAPGVPLPLPASPPVQPQSSKPAAPAVAMKPAMLPQTVQPASYTPVSMGLPAEIEPAARTLRDALAPSARITAAKGLAEGRHGSTDAVKAVLFHSAKSDPCPAVKAACIEHLCKLGYYDPAFIKHIKGAADDSSDEVKAAAKAALTRMKVQ